MDEEHRDELPTKSERISFADLKEYVFNNRFQVASLTWMSIIVASGISLWANPKVPPAQKVIHARMIAQGAVLSFLLGMAFTSAKDIPVVKENQLERINKRYYDKVLDGSHQISTPNESIVETKLERTRRLCGQHVKQWEKCLNGRPGLDENGLPTSLYCVDNLIRLVDCAAPKVLPSSSIKTSSDSTTLLATSLFKQLQLCTKSVMTTGTYWDATLGSMRDCSSLRQGVMTRMQSEGWEWDNLVQK